MKTVLNCVHWFLFVVGFILFFNYSHSQYIKLHDFNDYGAPGWSSSLFFDGTHLYGMSYFGSGIFKIKPDGTDSATIYSLTLNTVNGYENGLYLVGSLISDGTYLYGWHKLVV